MVSAFGRDNIRERHSFSFDGMHHLPIDQLVRIPTRNGEVNVRLSIKRDIDKFVLPRFVQKVADEKWPFTTGNQNSAPHPLVDSF